jgi:hypothetical protein
VVSRKGGAWRAAVTEVGACYLRAGAYPPDPQAPARPAGSTRPAAGTGQPAPPRAVPPTRAPGAPVLTPPAGPAGQQAEDLVARVMAAGGVMDVPAGNRETDYDLLVAAARAAPGLPSGKQLRIRHTGLPGPRSRRPRVRAARAVRRPGVLVPKRLRRGHAAARSAPAQPSGKS